MHYTAGAREIKTTKSQGLRRATKLALDSVTDGYFSWARLIIFGELAFGRT